MKNIYMHEKISKRIYDGVREYCIAERVNEEYLRASIGQKGLRYKPAVIKIIMGILHIAQ